MSDLVLIHHPELDVTSEVPLASLPGWIQSGWELVDDHDLSVSLKDFLKGSLVDRGHSAQLDKAREEAFDKAIEDSLAESRRLADLQAQGLLGVFVHEGEPDSTTVLESNQEDVPEESAVAKEE